MSFFGLFGDSIEGINKEIEAENKRHQDAMTSLNERKTKALTSSSSSGSFSVFSPGTWFGSSPSSTPPPTTTTTTNQPNQTGGGKKKNKKSKTKKNVVRQQQQQMISFSSGYTVGGRKKKRRVKTIKKRKQ